MKKAKTKYIKRKPRYANGTGYQGVVNYLETPQGELTQNQINVAKAKENAASNPWVIGLNTAAQLINQYGPQALGALKKDESSGNAAGMAGNLLGAGMKTGSPEDINLSDITMAYGGSTGKRSVEVENKEVGEMPNGEMVEFKGPTHENGGIDVNLPNGTEIFSERIKVMGKSMAERKKEREKNLLKIQTKLDQNPTDAILKSTFEKIQADNEIADASDMQIQQVIDVLQKGANGEFALGGILGDGIDPDNVDPTEMNLAGQKLDGTTLMPNKFQGKYVHYAPTTSLNPQDEYHRTLGDLWKNLITTKKSRMEQPGSLVTVEFANGGVTGEPDPNAPIQTYEGADTWNDYLKYQDQLSMYDTYSNEATRISGDLGEGTVINPKQFNAWGKGKGFNLPEGATGAKVFEQGAGYEVSPDLKGNYFVDESTGNLYIPTYNKPEGNYEVIEDPAVTAEKQRVAAWEQETSNIQGYVRNTYYDPSCNCNRTEEVPLPVGQDIPTDGTFIPKSATPPPNWPPKGGTPQMKNGGKVNIYANGGETGGLPIDPNDFVSLLNMISANQTVGEDLQNIVNMDYSGSPDISKGVSIPSQNKKTTSKETNDGPFAYLNEGEFPGSWDEYQKWKGYKDKGIDPMKINADGTYGDTGLKLMDDSLESDFVLDNLSEDNKGTETINGETIKEKSFAEKLKNLEVTPGNLIGLSGNAVSSLAPLLTTLKSRATDTPNINAFSEFGKEGITKIEEAIQFADDTKAANLQALEEKTSSQRKRNRNTARGVNTMRALDLQTEANANLAENAIHNNFAGLMSQLLVSQAQLENQQDKFVMSGEQARDLADRQDKDTFYTNLGIALGSLGLGLQETGKDINITKQQETMMNLLNQFSKYGITVDNKGNLGTNG